MSSWVSYALRQGQFFKPALISGTDEGIERLFRCEHLLFVVRIEIASDYNALNAGHCASDHVMNVHEELRNSDFTFLNVLGGFRFPITVSN